MRRLRYLWPLLLVVLMAATCKSNYADAGTISEGMGPSTGNESILDGPVDRKVVLTIPAGGLEGATSGEMILRVNTGIDPFPPVRFDIGPPFNESVVVEEHGVKY